MAAMIYGIWDEGSDMLTITRPSGQVYRVKNARSVLGRDVRVFGVETVGNQVHVLVAPRNNQRPNRRIKFSDSGTYMGSNGI
jgi:hypothetical protein